MRAGGIVLCGGKSTRMGAPKANLMFGDETMLARVVRILGEVVSPLVVVAAREQSLPSLASHCRVTHDQFPDRGPLAGLHAGLTALQAEVPLAFVCAVDAPLLAPDFVRQMLAELGDAQVAVPTEERDGQTLFHPLAAVYRVDVLPVIADQLASERLRLMDLFLQVRTQRVPVERLREVDPQLLSLRNVNSPEELAEALALGLGSNT